MDDVSLSVGEFVALVNQTFDHVFGAVKIVGEVAEYSVRQEKWVRFKLKDDEALIDCFSTVWQLPQPLEDGMKVEVSGVPKLSDRYGFSFTVNMAVPVGEGAHRRAYELLFRKLESEGLFAEERKRSLVRFPQKIGVVTSRDAAAWSDFSTILSQRWGGMEIVFVHSAVQGNEAATQLINAINTLEQTGIETLVITRGGGSMEDLSAFNDEKVVRTIGACRIPTIVAVGHERDMTLAELVADVRASTPSDAAKRVVPSREEIVVSVDAYRHRLDESMSSHLERFQQRIAMGLQTMQVLPSRLMYRIDQHRQLMVERIRRTYQSQLESVVHRQERLDDLNPRTVLRRGYAIVRLGGTIVRDVATLKLGDSLMIQLTNGRAKTEVVDVSKQS